MRSRARYNDLSRIVYIPPPLLVWAIKTSRVPSFIVGEFPKQKASFCVSRHHLSTRDLSTPPSLSAGKGGIIIPLPDFVDIVQTVLLLAMVSDSCVHERKTKEDCQGLLLMMDIITQLSCCNASKKWDTQKKMLRPFIKIFLRWATHLTFPIKVIIFDEREFKSIIHNEETSWRRRIWKVNRMTPTQISPC